MDNIGIDLGAATAGWLIDEAVRPQPSPSGAAAHRLTVVLVLLFGRHLTRNAST